MRRAECGRLLAEGEMSKELELEEWVLLGAGVSIF